MKNQREIWKDLKDYEGMYYVSSLGRIKSIKFNRSKILKQKVRNTYLSLNLYKNGIEKTHTMHILVAIAFHNHKPDGTNKIVVDHIKPNRLDNRAVNLQLITHRKNLSKDKKRGSSKYTGVYYDKERNKWRSQIDILGKTHRLGRYISEIEAHHAYQSKLSELNQ